MEYLSQRAFAQLPEINVSNVRINKLVKEGRLPSNEKGQIPKDEGIKAWATCRIAGFEAAGRNGGDAQRKKFDHAPKKQDDSDETAWTQRLNIAKTKKEEASAERAQLALEIERREYVHIDEIKHEAEDLAAMVRQKLIAIAPAVGARSEGKTAQEIQRIVELEINEVLKALQNIGEF